MREKSYTLKLKTNYEEFIKLEKFVETISDEYNISHTYFSNIIVTLSELVRNAMTHGNKNRPDRNVLVTFSHNEGKLYFSVEDQGKGFPFSLDEVSDIPASPHVKKGLSIVHSLSDGIEITNNGSKITVYFDISAANEMLSKVRIHKLRESNLRRKTKRPMHD